MRTVVVDDQELVDTVLDRFGKRSTDWIESVRRDGPDIAIKFHGRDVPIKGNRTVPIHATDLLKAWQLFLGTSRWDNHVSADLSSLTSYGAELLLLQASLELLTEDQWRDEDAEKIEVKLSSGADMSDSNFSNSLIWKWRQWRDGVQLDGMPSLSPNESMTAASTSELDARLRQYAEARSRQLGIGHYSIRALTLVTLWSDIERHAREMALRYAMECFDEDISDETIMEAAGAHIGDEVRRQWSDDVERHQNRRNELN